jgi:hypothetical protein
VERRGSGQRRGIDLETAVVVNPGSSRDTSDDSSPKSSRGRPRLAPEFVEYLMGFPAGFTDLDN